MPEPVQPPLGPMWLPPRRPAASPVILSAGVAIVALLAFVVLYFLALARVGFAAELLGPSCGVVLLLVVVFIAAAMGASQRPRSLPPPPPVPQPMVPAGMTGPIAMNCPNCGAPPEAVDRFGVATCTHCATRFLVR